MRSINLSLKTRFLMVFSLATVVLVLALGVVSYTLMVGYLRENLKVNLVDLARNAALEIDHTISDKQMLLAQVARAREVTDFPQTYRYLPLARHLSEFREDFPELSFVNADGVGELRIQDGHTSPDTESFAGDSGFLLARQNPGQVVIERHPTQDALVFTLGMQQYFGDVFFGCLRAVVPFENIIGHLGKVGVGQTGLLGLIDGSGSLFDITRKTNEQKQSMTKHLLSPKTGDSISDGIVVLDSSLGLHAFSAYSRVEAQPWYATAVLPYDEFMLGPHKLAWSFVWVGALLLLSGCAAVFFLSDRLAMPLRRLVGATREVAIGNWQEIEILKAPGEIDELVRAFNDMTRSLKLTTVSRDYLDNVLESMHESLIVVGLDGRIERTNRATCEMLGYDSAELTGKSISLLLPEKSVAAASWIDQITRSSGHFSERVYRHKQGKDIPVTFSWARFSSPGGKTHGLVCLAQVQSLGHKPSDWRQRMRRANGRTE